MKMIKTHLRFINVILLLVILLHNAQGKSKIPQCPIGFELAYARRQEETICYRQKGPEAFTDKFVDCPGNLYTAELYHDLSITTSVDLWSEYKSLYPGGPYIDWSYTESSGHLFRGTYDVHNSDSIGINEDSCVIINSVTNYTAVSCDGMFYRYCFVEPIYDVDDMTVNGCEDFKESWRFFSPVSSCLGVVYGVGGGTLRATWGQAKELCEKRNSSLLGKGWRYTNYSILRDSEFAIYPLSVVSNDDHTKLRFDDRNTSVEVPKSEWNFDSTDFPSDATYGAVNDDLSWLFVNKSYIFYDLICERTIQLESVMLNIDVDAKNEIMLSTSQTVNKKHIHCFTDSFGYYPETVTVVFKEAAKKFILVPKNDGYYWCIHDDFKNFNVTESNKVLYIREKLSLVNMYAVKITQKNKYRFETIKTFEKIWEKKLKEYVFYGNEYAKLHGKNETANPKETERILKEFKQKSPSLDFKDNIMRDFKTKRLYLDARTVLIHVVLNPRIKSVPPSTWDNIEIISMKPVYHCKGVDTVPTLSLGQSTTIEGCRTYTCVGDFNEGVQWLITATEGCLASTTFSVDTSARLHHEITLHMPTAGTLLTTENTPKDQLQQVMTELENLINNELPITMEDITPAFSQVDELLSESEDLEIPSNLLHLLDRIGARVNLTDPEEVVKSVQSNIALLITKAQPEMPVNGLRIVAGDTDEFTEFSFQVIRGPRNSSTSLYGDSELYVELPESVATSGRRISFVAFRTDRAFQSGGNGVSVNSRVLSVNVEDLTEFQAGEVIDIQFNPFIGDPGKNQTRTCVFWQFNDDGTAGWSEEGCTLIKATQEGMMDICRCTHLTHFAEILMPRTSFGDGHELALELITVIGCCMSIIGLLIIGLTAILFRSWRRDFSNKIWLQLCLAIFILVTCFLTVVYAGFDNYNIGCMFLGVLLHYSTLASFCWMLVAAIISYRRLVMVFTRDASHKLLKASVFSWGAPMAIVAILLSINPQSYAGQFDGTNPSGSFCYPSGLALWISVYAPIATMLLANWTLFILIVRSVFASRGIQRHGDSKEALRCASVSCLLVFLFGLPWIFGLFPGNLVTVYFFTLTSTFQGFVLFVFFVLGNKKTRDLWLNKLKIKQTRKVPVTSSTYTNRSTGNPGWRENAPAAPNSQKAKVTKPKSLASTDNSRFS